MDQIREGVMPEPDAIVVPVGSAERARGYLPEWSSTD